MPPRKLTQTKTITYVPGVTGRLRPTKCELLISGVTIRVSFGTWAHQLGAEEIDVAVKWFSDSLKNLKHPEELPDQTKQHG